MSLRLLLVFALTELLLSLTPGPAVLLVISQGVRRGFLSSIASALGVLTGNAIYFALSAVGLGALLIASEWLFEVIRWIGVAYLVFVGVQIIRRAGRQPDVQPEIDRRAGKPQAFAAGLLTQLLNPKAVVFFTALLPQFISPGENVAFQFVVLGITSIAVEFPVLMFYGFCADRGRIFISKGKYSAWSERIAGGFLIGAGVSLVLVRRA